MKSPGQLAYERDLARATTYDDGVIRPEWEKLKDYEKLSWECKPKEEARQKTAAEAARELRAALNRVRAFVCAVPGDTAFTANGATIRASDIEVVVRMARGDN